jgi:hypothetical protein
MKNFGKTLAATAGLLGVLVGAPAVAGPVLQAATCNSTINLGSSGSVAYQNLGAGVCVQVIDKLFGGFTFTGGTGTFVPDNLVTFNTLVTQGFLLHQISFNNAYVNGLTYNVDSKCGLARHFDNQLAGDCASAGTRSTKRRYQPDWRR